MSVRAYRVNKIDHEQDDSFNLWHDDELVDFLDREYGLYEGMSSDGCGLVELPVEALEEAIKKLKLDDELVKALKQDIEACRESGYITYYCY